MDGGRRPRHRGDRQSCRKIKQQAKNYREITSKYKINTEQKDWQEKKNYVEIKAKHGKANTNKENNRRYAQAGGHQLVKNR
jgi:hypothetical protein